MNVNGLTNVFDKLALNLSNQKSVAMSVLSNR